MGQSVRRPGSITALKRGTYKCLQWIFEGDALLPALIIFLYTLVWCIPVYNATYVEAFAEVWHFLNWQPNPIWALVFTGLAGYQVICCRLIKCIWWMQITTSVILSAFVIYIAVAPAYAFWKVTGLFGSTVAGAVVAVFSCCLLVSRNLHREDTDGGRGT